MPRLAWYEPDHREFNKFMVSQRMSDTMHEAATAVAAIAQGSARRGRTGQVARGYKVDRRRQFVNINDGTGSGRRAISEVYNDAPGAVQEEFGGRRQAARRTLGRAAASIYEPAGKLRRFAAWGR